jgi:hypothetical protein
MQRKICGREIAMIKNYDKRLEVEAVELMS